MSGQTPSDRPAAEGLEPGWYPSPLVEVSHTAPVPRRVRAFVDAVALVDTQRATYVWEHPYYPQFYVPGVDVNRDLIGGDAVLEESDRGPIEVRDLVHGDRVESGAVRHLVTSLVPGLDDTYRFSWSAADAWFEEDERVFVHPRSPYVRVDALRSHRLVRIEKDGVMLAESRSPVAVFETGLPTRWYLDRTDVSWEHLEASDTTSDCPYKGTTSNYWSVRVGDAVHDDLAWGYDFPTRQLTPITGLVCFYNEKVDVFVDGGPEGS